MTVTGIHAAIFELVDELVVNLNSKDYEELLKSIRDDIDVRIEGIEETGFSDDFDDFDDFDNNDNY